MYGSVKMLASYIFHASVQHLLVAVLHRLPVVEYQVKQFFLMKIAMYSQVNTQQYILLL